MSFQERRRFIQEKNNQRKENREKVSKKFEFETSMEEAKFEMVQECNGVTFEITRKLYNQVRGKQVSFSLNKQEVEHLKDYLEQALENWNEWNSLDK